jgi:hypothetical protein
MRPLSLALLALVLLAVPAAEAAPWKRVTTPDLANSDQAGVARTADGVLHLVWSPRASQNTEDLRHTAIAANGRLGVTSAVQSGWAGLTNAALVVEPAGLRVFVGGQRSTDPSEANDELSTLLSTDGGGSWSLQAGNVVPDGGQAYGSPVAAATLPSGGTLQTWAGTLGTWVHAGLSPVSPIFEFQGGDRQYGYNPNLAADAAGGAMLSWFSSASGRRGVLARQVGANAAPVGAALTMPGTGGMTTFMSGLTPLVARPGGGFYTAYPVGRRFLGRDIMLWRIGDSSARRIARTSRPSPALTLAATADGRLWLAWVNPTPGGHRVLAARTNPEATVVGAVVSWGRPRRTSFGFNLSSSATPGGLLDVLANFTIGTSSNQAIYHRRLLPGLTLLATPGRLRRDVSTDVRFTVLDAGDPVQGARVRVGGSSGRTGANGTVTLELPGRSATARATKAGYVRATRRIRAVRPR